MGGYASATLGVHEETVLRLPGDVQVRFAPEGLAFSRRVLFRTGDGLDLLRAAAQRADLGARNLIEGIPGTGIYLVENADSDEELPPFELSAPEEPTLRRAWFAWDEARQRWMPLPTQRVVGGRRVARSVESREYALLVDLDAPVFVGAEPAEGSPIPFERYFVDVTFRDEGSGIAEAVAFVDGEPTSVRLFAESPERAVVRYVPTDLAAGLHLLRVRVTDRTGNTAEVALRYSTVRRFAFTGMALVPNPARTTGRVFFQLTESADVTLDIFTPDGSRVYHARLEGVSGGLEGTSRESFVWDLANTSGRRVAGGIYIVRLVARNASGEEIRRFAKWAIQR